MRHLHLFPWGLSLLLLLALAGVRPAQGSDALSIELRSVGPASRSHAPIPVEAELDWQGGALLEGRLEMVFRDGNALRGKYRSADLTLTNGKQRFRMLLPPMSVFDKNSPLRVDTRFITERRSVNLEQCLLFVPGVRQRSLVICVSDPWGGRDSAYSQIARSLQLVRFRPESRQPSLTSLVTFPATLAPEDLPAHPLGYCSYDLVFLGGEGFSHLRQRQLEALRRWVEAGGSVCVFPSGALKPYQIQFLNDLTGTETPTFSLDEEGYLNLVTPFPPTGIGMYHSGLGRSVVVTKSLDPETDLDSPAWRQVVAFLWKMRADQTRTIVKNGKWEDRVEGGSESSYQRSAEYYSRHYGVQPGFQVLALPSAGRLPQALMPGAVRLVPFGAIVLILALFVLAIGPLDYFLLGFLRRRRLTWVLFPCLSIGFALFAIQLSEHYMSRVDRRAALSFVDVGKGGRVLRQNRFELLFAAREKEAVTEVRSALFTPLGTTTVERTGWRASYEVELIGSSRCWYEGRLPVRYRVRQEIRQWKPQLNRVLSLESPEVRLDLNWDGVDTSRFAIPSGRGIVMERLQAGRAFDGVGYLLHNLDAYALGGDRAILRLTADFFEMARSQAREARVVFRRADGRRIYAPYALEEFITEVCVRPEVGLFSVVSQISPTGADNFEDLTLLDPSDPNQWLLVVVAREGEDYIVYRRLYHAGE